MSHIYDRNYIDGGWRAATGDHFLDVDAPNTGALAARVACGDAQDAVTAVQAAQRAFGAWSALALAERVRCVCAWGASLAARKDALARAVASEVGTPLKISHIVQVESPIRNIDNFIACAEQFIWQEPLAHSMVVREAYGVVACITPWNFPLHQIVLKLAPALLAGNTVVLKPSELTPQTTQLICEAFDEAGFPAGVVNVVNGLGPTVGAALAACDGVDMVSFTGSTQAGRAVTALAAQTIKKVSTELGGKSPTVVLPGADLARAVKAAVGSCTLNNGQTCSALTRLLVPRDAREAVHALVAQELAKLTVGDSLTDGTRIGPLISRRQMANAQALVAEGLAAGAEPIADAADVPAQGFFVAPQAYWVGADNPLARQEVFGPVLSVTVYDGVDQAVQIANDTVYGLAAAVWGEGDEALVVAQRIRAGQVAINGARFNPLAPFGGYKQSGVGREAGRFGLEEFLQTKSIQINAPQPGAMP